MKPITSFSGEYRLLSNFWEAETEFEGITYPSSEHAYVAAKTADPEVRAYIVGLKSPGAAKRFGRSLIIRDDWDTIKVDCMRQILQSKFSCPHLLIKLIATAPAELIEGNAWGDQFWGQSPVGVGQNWLGKLLMEIRD